MNKKILFAFLVVAVIIAGCVKVPEEKPEVKVPEEVVPTEEVTPEAEEEKVEVKPVTEAPTELITDVTCSEKAIKLTLTNIEDSEWTITGDVVFRINAAIDKSPGCDKETLAPGESARCETIDEIPAVRKSSVLIITKENKELKWVQCE